MAGMVVEDADGADGSAHVADMTALAAFLVDNPDLDRLYALTGQFNIFEALGVARQELRHSDFLAFLLDPRQPHGLGDAFAQRFVQQVVAGPAVRVSPISAVETVLTPFTGVSVAREWNWVDLLLVSEAHRLAVIVENKVGAGEGRGQLARYEDAVRRRYPNLRLLKLYLTPDRAAPSDPSWVAIDYKLVAECVEAVVARHGESIDPVVRALLTHYVALLRRHVVADSEIAELCRAIYRKHQRALDLIFEHRPDALTRLAEEFIAALDSTEGVVLIGQERAGVQVAPVDWESEPVRYTGDRGEAERALNLYARITTDGIDLFLVIDPGPQRVRQAITALARAAHPLLKVRGQGGRNWTTIYRRTLLEKRHLENLPFDRQVERLRDEWTRFVAVDLPRIVSAIDPEQVARMIRELPATRVDDGVQDSDDDPQDEIDGEDGVVFSGVASSR